MSPKRFRSKYLSLRPWSPRELIPVVLGVLWLSIGSAYCLDEWSPKAEAALVMPLSIAPQQTWGVLFVFCGILAILSSRWPPHQDTWGYVVIGACSMWWGCAYTVGAIVNDGRSWSGAAVWYALCVLLYAVNSALEPSKKGV